MTPVASLTVVLLSLAWAASALHRSCGNGGCHFPQSSYRTLCFYIPVADLRNVSVGLLREVGDVGYTGLSEQDQGRPGVTFHWALGCDLDSWSGSWVLSPLEPWRG